MLGGLQLGNDDTCRVLHAKVFDISFERPHDNNTTNLGYKVRSISREYYTSQKQESHITAVGGLTSI